MSETWVRAEAPGRVNLIGDHTDHTGGWVLPAAIDRTTVVEGELTDEPVISLESDAAADALGLTLPVADPAAVAPEWARYVAGVAAGLAPEHGFRGTVRSTVPLGGGLSSSAALLVATALAMGADPADPVAVAQLCQRAEQTAAGVPCGVMDHLASLCGRPGQALLIDTTELTVESVQIPDDLEIRVVDSGVSRELVGSAYAERRARCENAAREVGSLRGASPADVERISDPVTRAAGRHVVSENRRVLGAAGALRAGDLASVGLLMAESHASLRDDLDVSTPEVDALVDRLVRTPGVHGARMTGAGFGGWVVVLARPGALTEGIVVTPSRGATVSRGSTRR